MTLEPMDCDHECVCWKFRYDRKQQEGMLEFCCRNDCIYDTRIRKREGKDGE